MPRVQSHILVHTMLFSSDNGFRLDARMRRRVNAFIAQWHRREKHTLHAVSMEADHLHLLAQLRPSVASGAYVKKIKSAVARWINRRHPNDRRFLWDHEWRSFSISSSRKESERAVIFSQWRVHKRRDSRTELAILQRRNGLRS